MPAAKVVSKTLEEFNVCLCSLNIVMFLNSFRLSSTPVVLLNYRFVIILEDNVRINQSKTSNDFANKLRHKRYTLSILIASAR